MRISPLVLIRALISQLSPAERYALADELLDGAVAALRAPQASVLRLISSEKECE